MTDSGQIDALVTVNQTAFFVSGRLSPGEGEVTGMTAVSPEGERIELGDRLLRFRTRFECNFATQSPSSRREGWTFEIEREAQGAFELSGPVVVDALQRRARDPVEIESVTDYGRRAESPAVSIVIPLYKRIDFVSHQVLQFARDPAMAGLELIYVLDSPELSGSLAVLASAQHKLHGLPFRVVRLSGNAGFAQANNLGASVAGGRHLLLLNSDVLPDHPGWLDEMTAFYDDTEKIGALGPKLLYEDESIQHAGMYFQPEPGALWGNQHYYKGLHRSFADANVTRPVPAVTGACMMIDRLLYQEVGGLRGIFMQGGYEDSDLCLRLLQTGRQNWYLPEVELYHLESQSYPIASRAVITAYNTWLQTQLWRDEIELLMTSSR